MKQLLHRWFSPRLELGLRQREHLARWKALPEANRSASYAHSRFVVVDVETTGLNLVTDTLISIAAVAVVNSRIALGDSFSVVLKQRVSSAKANILLHGISDSVQRAGVEPQAALLAFLAYLGKDPLVAFHVTFDETMIRRAMRQYLGLSFKHPWLDLAYVMPALNPALMHSHRVLDDWTRHFSVPNDDRHNAVADAFATAQLLLLAMHQSQFKHQPSYAGLRDLERMFRHDTGKA